MRVAGHARGGGSTCTGRHLSGCTARPGLPARRVPLVLGDSRSETPRPMEPPRRPTPARRAGDQGTELRNAPCPADLVPTLCREPAQCVAGAGFAEAAGHTAAGRKSRAFLSPSARSLPPPPAPARRSGLAWEGAPGEGVGRRGPACSGSSARLEVSSGAAAQGPSAPRAQGRLNPGPAVRVGARRPRGCDPASGQAAPRLRCVAADTAWGVLRSRMGGCGRGGADRRLGAGERKAGGRE